MLECSGKEIYRKRQMSSTYTAPTQSIKLFPVIH